MPPFGNLYGMPVYVDASLTEDEEIAFNACSHTELVQLAYKDFQALVKPTVAAFKGVGEVNMGVEAGVHEPAANPVILGACRPGSSRPSCRPSRRRCPSI